MKKQRKNSFWRILALVLVLVLVNTCPVFPEDGSTAETDAFRDAALADSGDMDAMPESLLPSGPESEPAADADETPAPASGNEDSTLTDLQDETPAADPADENSAPADPQEDTQPADPAEENSTEPDPAEEIPDDPSGQPEAPAVQPEDEPAAEPDDTIEETPAAQPDAPAVLPDDEALTEPAAVTEETEEEKPLPVSEEEEENASVKAAFSGTCGANILWYITGDTLLIDGMGEMYDYDSTFPGYYSSRNSIKKITISSGVTAIGKEAFANFGEVTEVTIPSTVTSIRTSAFSGCGKLPKIDFPSGITSIEPFCFFECTSLKAAMLPSKLTSIGMGAFEKCSGILAVSMPSTVEVIGDRAFMGCSSLPVVMISPKTNRIGDYAFHGCTKLKTITFRGFAPTFGEDIFYNVKATARYAEGDPTWTASVRKNYGGNITWVADSSIPVNPMEVTLNKKNATLATKKTLKLKATVLPPAAADKSVTWSSNHSSIASVDSNGLVTAKKYGKVKITATTVNGYKATCTIQTRFWDVNNPKQSCYDPVYWAVNNGITKCSVEFRPNDSVTRGEFTAFLYRFAGSPAVWTITKTFSDVNSSTTTFLNEIMWAVNEDIIKGYSDGTFRPKAGMTREMCAIMLWRYAGKPEPASMTSPFSDVKPSAADSYKAILWGAENGIIKGSGGKFLPKQECTRGTVVTFLYRYMEKFGMAAG